MIKGLLKMPMLKPPRVCYVLWRFLVCNKALKYSSNDIDGRENGEAMKDINYFDNCRNYGIYISSGPLCRIGRYRSVLNDFEGVVGLDLCDT